MTLLLFGAAFVVVVLGAAVQSSVGFGANLVAMPIVTLFAPELVPGAILVAVLVMNALMLRRDRASLELRPVRGAILGRIIGTGLGFLVLRALADSENGLKIAVALAVLLMVVIASVGKAPARTFTNMVGAGTVSGVTAMTAGIGGPPVALLFKDASGSSVRGSMGGFFTVGTVVTLTGLALAGSLGQQEVLWGLGLVPATVLGFLLSGPLLPIVDRGITRPAILTLSTAAALVLLVQVIF